MQKKFLNFVCYQCNVDYTMSYEEKCRYFKIQTLSSRRNVSEVIFLNKLFNNKIDCAPILRDISFYVPSRHLRQQDLFLNCAWLNLRKNSPLLRAQSQVNGSDLDVFDNVVTFKRKARAYFSVPWLHCFLFHNHRTNHLFSFIYNINIILLILNYLFMYTIIGAMY